MGAEDASTRCASCRDLQDVSTDQQSDGAAVKLQIDRDAAGRFGITPADIDAAIYDQIGQHEVAQYFTQLNAYHVIVEAPPSLQASPELFNQIYIKSPLTGKTVPLSLFVRVDPNAQRPAGRRPSGPAAGRHAVVQSQRRAWRSAPPRPDRAGPARPRGAGDFDRLVPGHGAGVRAVAGR